MRFVYDDETEILNWRKQSRARPNDDLRFGRFKGFFPDLMAYGFGLGGMKNDDVLEMRLKIADDLRGERDLWYENDDGLAFC